MARRLNRGDILAGLGLLPLSGLLSACASEEADEALSIDITWQDLIPQDGGLATDRTNGGGEVQHEELSTGFTQPTDNGVVEALNNKRVRIPGFVLPVVMTAEGVTAFLLVPYVGAYIHVPPPPPNQLVFVTSPNPYTEGTLYDPVRVTGFIETMAIDTDLAQAGYTLDAEEVERYVEQLG